MALPIGAQRLVAQLRQPTSTHTCVAPKLGVSSHRVAVQAHTRIAPGTISTRVLIAPRAVRADQQTDAVDSALLQTIAQITEKVDEAVAATLAASAEAAKALDASTDSELRR